MQCKVLSKFFQFFETQAGHAAAAHALKNELESLPIVVKEVVDGRVCQKFAFELAYLRADNVAVEGNQYFLQKHAEGVSHSLHNLGHLVLVIGEPHEEFDELEALALGVRVKVLVLKFNVDCDEDALDVKNAD